jgi:hypothetical protein
VEGKSSFLAEIESLQVGAFERVDRIGKAVNALILPNPIRKEFLAHEKVVRTLFQAVKPDPTIMKFLRKLKLQPIALLVLNGGVTTYLSRTSPAETLAKFSWPSIFVPIVEKGVTQEDIGCDSQGPEPDSQKVNITR